jgi:hypothetical protein
MSEAFEVLCGRPESIHAKRHDEHVEVNRCPGLSIPKTPFPMKHQFPMAGFL